MVARRLWCSRLISARVWTRSLASRFESGSSNRKTRGWRTSARPSATRWRSPPDSSRGRRPSDAVKPQDFRGLADAAAHLGGGQLAALERERHVLADRHVRIERVVLEHHGDVAVARRQVVDAAGRRSRSRPRSRPRARRSCAARWTCRSPTGPTSTMNSPSSITRSTSLHRAVVAAVELADVLEPDLRHAGAPAPGSELASHRAGASRAREIAPPAHDRGAMRPRPPVGGARRSRALAGSAILFAAFLPRSPSCLRASTSPPPSTT